MTQIYNKGKYRNGELGKHLRPFLKRIGNKRWRKDLRLEVVMDREDLHTVSSIKRIRKNKKQLKVKFTMVSAGGFKHSYYSFYPSLKTARNAIQRHEVIRATVFDKNGKIIDNYENNHT